MPATAMAASLLKAIKNSPVGKFPTSAGKAGIKKNSPLGKQIAQSDRGKLPPMLGGKADSVMKNMYSGKTTGKNSPVNLAMASAQKKASGQRKAANKMVGMAGQAIGSAARKR
jgi:hypothetical protein